MFLIVKRIKQKGKEYKESMKYKENLKSKENNEKNPKSLYNKM